MRRAIPLALAALVVLAGCAGPGNRTPAAITANATKATVGEDALAATGYGRADVTEEPFTDRGKVTVSGDVQLEVEYRLEGSAWRATYRNGSDPPALFVVYSVPQVRPDDVAVVINPLADRSPAALATLAQSRYGDVRNVTFVGNRSVTMLGNETALGRYRATATVNGSAVAVTLHLAMVRHARDVILAVAVHPRSMREGDAVARLVAAVEH